MSDINPTSEPNFSPEGSAQDVGNLIPHIEALIFASDKPLANAEIADLLNTAFNFTDAADMVAVELVDAALDGIVEKYSSEFYPFEVRQSGGGWQFLTKKPYHKTVVQLNGEKFLKKLSAAALETLAIIAYKQPITKGEIESIRGVSSDYSVQKLLEKDLIIISGRNEKLPGHPLVYATSKSFMDYFGINSPEDLPKIKEVLAEAAVQPAIIQPVEESSVLRVTDEGELVDADEAAGSNGHDASAINGEGRLFIDENHTPTAQTEASSDNGAEADEPSSESDADAGEDSNPQPEF